MSFKTDDRDRKEILVFVATEYMADAYAFVLNHLTQLWAPVEQPITIPKEPRKGPVELLPLLLHIRRRLCRNRIGALISDLAPLLNTHPAQPELGKYIQIDQK